MSSLAIVEAFSGLPDARRGEGRRHEHALCLALFTLAVSAGCRGFLAINDWLGSYRTELLELFRPAKSRLPSYSTIRRVMLKLDYQAHSPHSALQLLRHVLVTKTRQFSGTTSRNSLTAAT